MLKLQRTDPLPSGKSANIHGLTLEWQPEARITHVNHSGSASSAFADIDCRPIAPGQFYVVGDFPAVTDPSVTLTDQSHGSVLLSLRGEKSEIVLSSLSGADLTAEGFARRTAIQTRLGHLSVNVKRTADEFSIIAPRSFVRSIWDDIENAMRIFG